MKKLPLIIALLFAFTTCKKGDTGAPGANGTNGTANVQTYLFSHQNWINSNSDVYITVPEITQTILDKATIDVYIRWTGANYWTPLPNLSYSLVIGLGYVDIFNNTGSQSDYFDLKVNIIPAP